MQASETKLQQITEGTKQYVVPLFQRPYSWKKAQWEALWNDLVELCQADNPRPHFMGSIVTMPTTSVPEGITKYLLIDGQQRLTTVFILLAALRDTSKSKDPELAEEIENTILVNPYKKGLDYYKLQPTQIDRETFHNLIKNCVEKGQNEIFECYRFFEKKIRQNSVSLDLSKIKKVICNNFSVVSVVLSHDDDPYLVFENLNAKGRPLTQSDLIRNYFFMRIHADSQESVHAQYWKPMQDLLGDNLTEFVRHYLTKTGVDVKQNEIYFELKGRISNNDALTYLEDLSSFSGYYSKLLDPTKETHSNIQYYLARINRLEVSTVYPFLLNCYDDWMKERITEGEFVEVLKIIENFILRRFICNVQTRGLNRIFALLYSQVSKVSDLESDSFVERLKLTLQHRDYPKDLEFKARLIDTKLYGSTRSKKCSLILESIETSFRHKEEISFEKVNIEHVMPQTITDEWKKDLGEDWAIIHDLYGHTLGNLTLTAYNPELSNHTFEYKKSLLQDSHLELNRYFQGRISWGRKDIEERADYLADLALKIWNYFGNESEKPSQSSQFTGTRPRSITLFGQESTVRSWREVLEVTINMIAELEPDNFFEIIEQFPRFIGKYEKDFRQPRKLRNNFYIEVNLSAQDIATFCMKALETVGLSSTEWKVETESSIQKVL
jgi:uncharacterized protein with ParB-like and HNH nuclease domain